MCCGLRIGRLSLCAYLVSSLSQAKDNVKYLSTLDKFLEPLVLSSKITSVIDALPALMNGMKMVYTVSRYYNTAERMTSLFIKITNQVGTDRDFFLGVGR